MFARGQKRKLDSDANDDFVMPPKRSAPTPQANGGGFARGRDTTTPVAAPARKVENDNLFGKSSRRKDNDRDNVKRRKKNSTKGKTSTKSSKNNDKKSKGADVLTYKQLRVGMVLLCAIKQVNETDLTVALPHGLTGYVNIREISDVMSKIVDQYLAQEDENDDDTSALPSLSSMCEVGQMVRCMVVGLEQKRKTKKITLSMRASLLNKNMSQDNLQTGAHLSASVVSKEDKGYVINLGLSESSTTGFLAFKDASDADDKSMDVDGEASKKELIVGQPIECVVLSNTSSVVFVTAKPSVSSMAITKSFSSCPLTLKTLQPGMLVKGEVAAVLKNGLSFRFLEFFTGSIDLFHLRKPALSNWSETFSEKQKFKARILYINYATKKISLSLKPHLLKMTPFSFPASMARGSVIESAVVTRIDGKTNLILQDVANPDVAPLCCHISRLSDKHIEKIGNKYSADTIHACRVMSHNYVDGLVNVSLNPSIIKEQILWRDDCKPGMVVSGEVLAIASFGLVISLSNSVKAICPMSHLSDIVIKNPTKKFKTGQKVRCRILTVDLEKEKVILTLKKSLVKSKLPVIDTYDNENKGTVTHAFITNAKDYGCTVEFYNGVHGLVPITELQRMGVDQHPSECYTRGQVIKVKVLNVNTKKKKMKLTFDLTAEPSSSSSSSTKRNNNVTNPSLGDVVSGTVVSYADATITLKLSAPWEHVTATIHATHLTDHPRLVNRLYRHFSDKGAVMDNLLVLQVKKEGVPILTRKPSLLVVNGTPMLPRHFNKLLPGVDMPLRGYVSAIKDYGVFVNFLGGLAGLARRSHLSDHFVTDPSDLFHIGQSVKAVVMDIDDDKHAFSISLQSSKVTNNKSEEDRAESGAFIQSYFRDLDLVRSALVKKSDSDVDWENNFAVGSLSQGKVQHVKEFGVLMKMENEDSKTAVTGLAASPHQTRAENGKPLEVSKKQVRVCRVLDRDQTKNIVDISLRPELTSEKKKSKKKASSSLAVGARVPVVVELVKKDYVVLTLPNHNHAVAFAATTSPNLTFSPHAVFKAGQQAHAYVQYSPSTETESSSSCDRTLVVMDLQERMTEFKGKSMKFYDKHIAEPSQILAGMTIRAKLTGIKPNKNMCLLELGANISKIQGRIHPSELEFDYSKGKKGGALVNPMDTYEKKIGEFLICKVLAVRQKKVEWSKKPIWQVDLSNKTERVNASSSSDDDENDSGVLPTGKNAKGLSFESIHVGSALSVHVSGLTRDSVWVDVCPISNIKGRIALVDASSSLNVLRKPEQHFVAGTRMQCVVSGIDNETHVIHLVAQNALRSMNKDGTYKQGQSVIARVIRLVEGRGVTVRVAGGAQGRLHITELQADISSNAELTDAPYSGVEVGSFLTAKVASILSSGNTNNDGDDSSSDDGDSSSQKKQVMLQLTRLSSIKPLLSFTDLAVNSVVNGYVQNTTGKGCFIAIARGLTARVLLKDLSDKFVKDVNKKFPAGRFVCGRITSINADRELVSMSLRKSSVVGPTKFALQWSDLAENLVLKGKVKRVESFGVFIKLQSSDLVGLAHISQISDMRIADLKQHYEEGDRVKCVIIKLDQEKKRISLALKADLVEAGIKLVLKTPEEAEKEAEKAAMSDDEDEDAVEKDSESEDESDDDSEDEEESSDDDDDHYTAARRQALASALAAGLADDDKDKMADVDESDEESVASLAMDMDDDDDEENDDEEDSDSEEEDDDDSDDEEDEEEDNTGKGNSRGAKARAKKREEREISLREEALLDENRTPETANDFERMLVSSPNSSFVWIRYVAYHLSMTEIEKARAVCERALKAISFKEAQEKFNVWMAFLNLENMYGNADSMKKLLARALEYNNPKHVYLELAKLYENSDKNELAEDTFTLVCRRFHQSAKVYIQHAMYKFRQEKGGEVRTILKLAVQKLPKRKHIKVITKFAQLEFQQGSLERGRTIMEGVLSNYPKRVDLWSQYLDMEIKAGHGDSSDKSQSGRGGGKGERKSQACIRRLFDRITSMSGFSTKKMKFFFKRYMDYESKHGDEDSVDDVKDKAREYVQSKMQE